MAIDRRQFLTVAGAAAATTVLPFRSKAGALASSSSPASLREHYPRVLRQVYLDCAAHCPLSTHVRAGMEKYMDFHMYGPGDGRAEYVDEAVNQIERWSEHLKSRDFSDLIKDTERLIRRQPALFIGSAFVIGLFGARFFKSSAQNDGSNARVHGAFPGRPSDRRPYGNTAKRPATGSTRPSTTSADEFSTEGL